jgi:hypothetical protein
MNDFLLIYIIWEVRTMSLNNCVTMLLNYAAGTYIPYTNFYFCKFYFSGTTLDATGVNMPVW